MSSDFEDQDVDDRERKPPPVKLPHVFEVEPYRPDGGLSVGGALQLIGFLGLTGIVLGGVASFVSQWFYLILLFPLAIGLLVGLVGVWGIKRFAIRRPLTCGVAGFVAGCLAMFSLHYFDYQRFDDQLNRELIADLGEEQARAIRELALQFEQLQNQRDQLDPDLLEFVSELEQDPLALKVLRVNSVFRYLDLVATRGIEIQRGGNGFNLGYTGSWIYWGIEVLIVAGLGFFMMRAESSTPFCVECHTWKVPRVLGALKDPAAVQRALEAGRVEPFEFDLESQGEKALLTVFGCPNCEQGTIVIQVDRLTVSKHGETTTKPLTRLTYPAEACESLLAACQPPEEPVPPPAVDQAPPSGQG